MSAFVYVEVMNEAQDQNLSQPLAGESNQELETRSASFEFRNRDGSSEYAQFEYSYPVRKRKKVLPAVLFALTCLSTFWVGITLWSPFDPITTALANGNLMNIRVLMLQNWDSGLIYMFSGFGRCSSHRLPGRKSTRFDDGTFGGNRISTSTADGLVRGSRPGPRISIG